MIFEELRDHLRAERPVALATVIDGASPGAKLLVAPVDEANETSREDIDELLRRTLGESSLKDAVATVADATGQPRKDIYRRALELVKEDNGAHD